MKPGFRTISSDFDVKNELIYFARIRDLYHDTSLTSITTKLADKIDKFSFRIMRSVSGYRIELYFCDWLAVSIIGWYFAN